MAFQRWEPVERSALEWVRRLRPQSCNQEEDWPMTEKPDESLEPPPVQEPPPKEPPDTQWITTEEIRKDFTPDSHRDETPEEGG